MNARSKPAPTEFAPYYGRYIDRCADSDLIAALNNTLDELLALLHSIPEDMGDHRYTPDKWTIKDVLQHMIDTERVFAYRALRFARNDSTSLPGFEEDDYARHAPSTRFDLEHFIKEAEVLRSSSILLFIGFDDEQLMRIGTANGQPCSARAAGWIIAGHTLHHMNVIQERYLQNAPA